MMKRILAAILCLVICALASCTFRETGTPTTDTPTNTATSGTVVPPATDPTSTATSAPTSPATSTLTSPTTDTPVTSVPTDPVTSEPPVTNDPPAPPTYEIPVGPAASEGVLSSNTGTPLNLETRWTAVANGDNVVVTVKLYLVYSSIYVGARSGCEFTVAGETSYFSTPKLARDDWSMDEMLVAEKTVTVPKAEDGTANVHIYASWYFCGVYSEVKIESIVINSTIAVK